MELFLEMVPPESLFLTQIPILIFSVRLSEFPNPLAEKGLVPKVAHVLTDALVKYPENVFLVKVSYLEKGFLLC